MVVETIKGADFMGEFTAIHTEVWKKLDKLAYENFQLKKANTKLRNELRQSRRQVERLRKGEIQHYRNGRRDRR